MGVAGFVPSKLLCWQVFGVLVATTGLASFALVLALVEQVVLEVIEDNVKRGSKVYQRGHVRMIPVAWLAPSVPCPYVGMHDSAYLNFGPVQRLITHWTVEAS